jgi:hypothetical protein
MKYLLLIGMIMAGLVLVQFAQGQTVDLLIDKYAEARGGIEKLLGIRSIYMEGARMMMGNEVMVKVTKEQGKLSRTEFEMGANNGFMIVTDKEGWNMFSMRSATPTKLPDEALALQQSELDIVGPLINYTLKGHQAELMGKDTVHGVVCNKIRLTTANGKEIRYWLDAQTHLLVQSAIKTTGNFFGRSGDRTVVTAPSEGDLITLYSDYQGVEGILFPHTIVTRMPGNIRGGSGTTDNSTTFDTIQLNIVVDPKLYKPE